VAEDAGSLYRSRRLPEGYPGLDARSIEWYQDDVSQRPEETPRVQRLLDCLDRLIAIHAHRNFLVVGCGPQPTSMRLLREMGFNVVGVEPVPLFIAGARRFLRDDEAVLPGRAEDLPSEDESQHVVLLESVLEHVDSVERTLAEAQRVLVPGGVAYVITTNRHRLGRHRTEFNIPFYPHLPGVVKESYVFQHLLYVPSLANYTERPAVHWFTFAELCDRGRAAGFTRFYSHLDLKSPEPSSFLGRHRRLKSVALSHIQRSPWLRAIALSQHGGTIFMVKR
jgi:ubiquinone/menaquinone biosynthesis C-methylase UbiE